MKVRQWLLLTVATLLPFSVIAQGVSAKKTHTKPGVVQDYFELTSFGAVGDGVTDDGPALQMALDALAQSGGGTLFVPAGHYVIATPVVKNFSGLAESVNIVGVESLVPVAPPSSSGYELTRGLALSSEFIASTGVQDIAINLSGLRDLSFKDISFAGRPDVNSDAVMTLLLADIATATITHCEFYGLSTLVPGGGIVVAVRTDLHIDQTVFLGSACSSGLQCSVVQNLEWKGFTISNSIFADYGQRPNYWGKLGLAAPYSWVHMGNAAPIDNLSPRREAVFNSLFLDEGGLNGLSAIPTSSVPIDLFYVTGLYMNVSNLNASGHYLYHQQQVLIEDAHYGWSHAADNAVNLIGVGNAILDRLQCTAAANRIRADASTQRLTVIDTDCTYIDSEAPDTRIITTNEINDDPVWYVRNQFTTLLNREPDAAAHFYWSKRILDCLDNATCITAERDALRAYLDNEPTANFVITGRVTTADGTGLAGVTISLSGSTSVNTVTDGDGNYIFDKLPTSGSYVVTASRNHYTFDSPSQTIITPAADQRVDFSATLNNYQISGRVLNATGQPLPNVNVSLSPNNTTLTNAAGEYSFVVPALSDYVVSVQRANYSFQPPTASISALSGNQTVNFTGTLVNYTISGQVLRGTTPFSGVAVTLSGTQNKSTVTDASGNYSFTAQAEGDYVITPQRANYSFQPSSVSISSLSENQTANFTGTLVNYTISGQVMTAGSPLSGVLMTLSGTQNKTTQTDANGNYSFQAQAEGNYVVTPQRANYSFQPSSVSITNLTANSTANFTGSLVNYTISGHVMAAGSPLNGTLITLSGTQSKTIQTDASGNYSFTAQAEGNYVVTLQRTNYSFQPSSVSITNLTANSTANFTGSLVNYTISGRVMAAGSPLSGAVMTLSGTQSKTTQTDANGDYSFQAQAEGNYVVTPQRANYSFQPSSISVTNLTANSTANFAGSLVNYTISGRVLLGSAPFSGVVVTLSGTQNKTTVTDASGNYSFTAQAEGNYVVTPQSANYSFQPSFVNIASLTANSTVNFSGAPVNYTISGRVISEGTPIGGITITLSGTQTKTAVTDANGNYSFLVPAGNNYNLSATSELYTFTPPTVSLTNLSGNQVIDFDATKNSVIEFSAATFNVNEGDRTMAITVKRTGNLAGVSEVTYSGVDGTADQGGDVSPIVGQLTFSANESSKTFLVLVADDAHVESMESLTLRLSNPVGAILGASDATLNILDNDSPGTSSNPIDDPVYFVRQHYYDFLNRPPDAPGLDFWSNQIIQCGNDAACIEDRRIHVSAAFFLSIEFQETGFLVYRMYEAAYARPPEHLTEFLFDTRAIGENLIVNAPGWQELLANNKVAVIEDFVGRSSFTTQYPLVLTPVQFVTQLNTKAGGVLTPDQINNEVAEFAGATTSANNKARARVLRHIAESPTLTNRELNPAFVMMQYFGYMQRNPNAPPDTNLDGYNFWLNKLNEWNGDYRRADMVKSFLVSTEYRERFGIP
jgi:hypothetical protein